MLFALGAVLKHMYDARRQGMRNLLGVENRLMWHLVKSENVRTWGWATVKAKALSLQWSVMPRRETGEVMVLCMLGHGSDCKGLWSRASSARLGR